MIKQTKKIMIAAAIFTSTMFCANAQNTPSSEEPTQARKTVLPPMKTLLDEGEKIDLGNYILLTRPVGKWILNCDLDLSHNKRVCWIQQSLKLGDNDLKLTFQNTAAGAAFFTIDTTANIDAVNGLHMGFSGLEKVLRNGADLTCDEKHCVGGFELSGIIGAAVMAASDLNFFFVNTDDDKQKMQSGQITMGGVKQAMELAATNPYAPLPGTPPAKTEKAEAKPADAKRTETKTEVAKSKRQQPRPQSTSHKKQPLY